MLDSDVQKLLGTEELVGDELTSSPQLQWASKTKFPSVVRLFGLNCCAIPVKAVGRGLLECPQEAVAGLDLGTQGGDVDVPLTGGPSGAANPSHSCAVVFIEIAAELEIVSDLILARWTATTYSVVGPNCCLRREKQRSRGKLCTVPSRLRGGRTRRFLSPSGEGAECEKGSGAKRDGGPSSEASTPSRIPGNSARSHARIRWQAGRPRSRAL